MPQAAARSLSAMAVVPIWEGFLDLEDSG